MADTHQKTYRILRLQADNILRLNAIDITPDGNLIEVTGKNGNGKSSLLQSIYMALAGKEAIPAKPIHDGEESAQVSLDLGDLKVTLKLREKDDGSWAHTLTVENEEGARFTSPQKMLSALIGELTFDPLEFTRLKPKDQFDKLKRFVPDFDFARNAEDRQRAFDERTDVNRDVKNLKSQVAAFSIPEGTPDAEIDVSALTDELEGVSQHNADIERRKINRENLSHYINQRREKASALEEQAHELRRQADEADKQAAQLREEADTDAARLADAKELPAPRDAADIREKINSAQSTNTAVREKLRMNSLIRQAEARQKEADALTDRIAKIDEEKAAAIAGAKMPVEGIGFAEDYVTLNGLPFNQASSAEQLRASVAIAIAANPKLRVILIKDGALLDDESVRAVSEMAEKHDVQIWMETVDSDRQSAIVIEDGRLRQTDIREAAE